MIQSSLSSKMLKINKYNVMNFISRKIGNDNFINVHPRPSVKFCMDYFKDKEIVVAEIGTFEGRNAKSILINLNVKKIYLIDLYRTYLGYEDDGSYNLVDTAYAKAKELLHGKEDKIKWLIDYSDSAVYDVEEKLDFVYIDGNHEYDYVKSDINLYYKKLKVGGVMGGHDIHYKGVRKAVFEFCKKNDIKLKIKSPDWYFIKSHQLII